MNRPPSASEVISVVSDAFGVEFDRILSGSRVQKVVDAKTAAVILMRDMCNYSWPDIARFMLSPNHTTVITRYRRWHNNPRMIHRNKALLELAKSNLVALVAKSEQEKWGNSVSAV